ncbi:MAG TPA: NAD-dependent epimerase/dehydratase family protein, partial [Chloroflexota bacterium]|nr:NAD-dependent epimerase/dehydratase family protein [Chloroflexota bacterium]
MRDKSIGLVLVTGGAGFIGCNLAAHYLSKGWSVRLFDNLSRPGTEKNLSWLKSIGDGRLEVAIADVRDDGELRRAASDADVIFHMASQVGVTTSVSDPRYDFEVNALGTLNMLEAARASGRFPVVVYASTNKVYGSMPTAGVELTDGGYRYSKLPMGVSEEWPLDFHSPYGCSKGAADQYVRDYARIYGLPTVVFRQSCVYGPHQFGNEDQGWVCHFAISALRGLP